MKPEFARQISRVNNIWIDIKDTIKEEAKPVILKPQDYKYYPVTVYDDNPAETLEQTKQEFFNTKRTLYQRLFRIFRMNEIWFFLMILGFSCALVGLACDTAMWWLVEKRRYLSSMPELGFVGNYIIWIILGVIFSCISAVCVAEIAPHSAGSGMPSMKSILSGLLLPQYLSVRCLVAKMLGVVGTIAAGLACGKEGPYVHICGMLAYQLTRVPIFRRIRQNKGIQIQMLAAGCAAGFGITFGAPIGGVLFSIETTSTYYLVQNLFKAFFCALCATLLIKLLGSDGLLALFVTSFNSEMPYKGLELAFFCIGGILYGLAGALFVNYVKSITLMRKKYKILQRPYLQAVLVAVVTSLLSFPLEPLRNGQSAIIGGFFVNGPMVDWQHPNVIFNLSLFTLIAFLLCGYTICIPIVSGLFTPVFILGASSGRLLGEVMSFAFPSLGINPGGYAVVGAAAFSAGVTRTVASGIIVFELTGQMTHLIPVLMTVLIAASVGNFFTASVYDTLLREKGLPFIPAIRNTSIMKKTVGDVMNKNLDLITTDMNYHELQQLLTSSNSLFYPIVDNQVNRIFLGQIRRYLLESKFFRHEEKFRNLSAGQPQIPGSPGKEKINRLIRSFSTQSHENIKQEIEISKILKKKERENRKRKKEKNQRLKEELELLRQQLEQLQPHVAQPSEPPHAPDNSENSEIPDISEIQELSENIPEKYPSNQHIIEPASPFTEKNKKNKKKDKIITRQKFFMKPCGFGNLAKHVALSQLPSLVVPVSSLSSPLPPSTTMSLPVSPSETESAPVEVVEEATGLHHGVDLSPFTVVETSPLSKVHFLFAVLGLSHVWVVRQGRLVGLITKEDLMNMEKD